MRGITARIITLFLCNAMALCGFAKELIIESFGEKSDDLTANTQAVYDFNNKKCALIKVAIPDRAAFEGNVVKSAYKTNEYYVYVSTGTKKILLKYPGSETLEIQLSDYLNGKGVESGRTYRLRISGLPEETPQITIVLPEKEEEKPEETPEETFVTSNNNNQENSYEELTEALKNDNLNDQDSAAEAIDKEINQKELNDNSNSKESDLLGTVSKKTQKFSISPFASFSLGNVYSMSSEIEEMENKSSEFNIGIDFGYIFWNKGKSSLKANIGLEYSINKLSLGLSDINYSYNAPPSADVDGNKYKRYYELQNYEQKFKFGYFQIPIYLSYQYQISKRIGIQADLGGKMDFGGMVGNYEVKGQSYSYGIYPEYGDLMIDAPWLNDFGTRDLSHVSRLPECYKIYFGLLVGATLNVNISGPVWFNVGLRYDCGFTNVFPVRFPEFDSWRVNERVPVSYTVDGGQEVKPLTYYLTSSRLSPLSIRVGLTFKF